MSFRDDAVSKFIEAFGEPETLDATGGMIYRWRLTRPHNLDLFITFDSPEMHEVAHVIVSDPSSKATEPVNSLTMRTIREVELMIERIRLQWKEGGNPR